MSNQTNSFRLATIDDVDAVVTLVQSAYRGDFSRQGWTTEADLLDGGRTDREDVASLIDKSDSVIILCEDNGKLTASCNVEKHDQDTSYFGMFAVVPTLQSRGIGRSMVEYAENFAKDRWRSSAMRMTVIQQRKELIAWYERLGYTATGETKPFPYGNTRFGIPKRDDLEFVVLEKRLR